MENDTQATTVESTENNYRPLVGEKDVDALRTIVQRNDDDLTVGELATLNSLADRIDELVDDSFGNAYSFAGPGDQHNQPPDARELDSRRGAGHVQ